MAYAIDTAAATRRLIDAGLAAEAARAIVETVAESDADAATRGDLAASEKALKGDLAALRADLAASEKALKGDLAALRADLAAVKAVLTMRIVAAQVATATLLFAALKWFA